MSSLLFMKINLSISLSFCFSFSFVKKFSENSSKYSFFLFSKVVIPIAKLSISSKKSIVSISTVSRIFNFLCLNKDS